MLKRRYPHNSARARRLIIDRSQAVVTAVRSIFRLRLQAVELARLRGRKSLKLLATQNNTAALPASPRVNTRCPRRGERQNYITFREPFLWMFRTPIVEHEETPGTKPRSGQRRGLFMEGLRGDPDKRRVIRTTRIDHNFPALINVVFLSRSFRAYTKARRGAKSRAPEESVKYRYEPIL